MKRAAQRTSTPWWWFEGGTEICSTCNQSYAYQTGSYCLDCDCNVCPLCVQESETNDSLCAACCGTLRDANEVILADDLTKPSGAEPTQKELTMAKQLVGMLQGEFDPSEYKDEYRQRVTEFIEKKAKGHAPRLKAVKTKRKTAALDTVLAKSIESLRKEKRAA